MNKHTRLTPPTVPVRYVWSGNRTSTAAAVLEWLAFLCTPLGMRS